MNKQIVCVMLTVLLITLMSVSAVAYGDCVDADRDYWCDDCGMLIPHTCIDSNKDTWCDKCSCWIPHTCTDKDGDHQCDRCGKVMDVKIHITVNSFPAADSNIQLVFYQGTYPSVIANLYGSPAEHNFTCAANSYFRLFVNQYGHPTRTFYYNTNNNDIDIDAQLYPYGDVSQDGKVNVGDVAKIYANVRGTDLITDDYRFECADVNGDGDLTVGDTAKVYAHIRGTKPLF